MKFIEELSLPIVVLLFVGAYAYDVSDIRDAGENLKLAAPLLAFLALSCLSVIASVIKKYRFARRGNQAAGAGLSGEGLFNRRTLSVLVLSILYLSILPYSGVMAATTLLVLTLLYVMEGRLRLLGVAYAIAFGATLLVVFEFLLGKDLPGHF